MGFYSMHRGWMDSEVFDQTPYSEREAWEWMIGEANWKPALRNVLGKPVLLQIGQFSNSIRFMADKFQWSVKRVRCYLEKLTLWGMIEQSKGTAQSIITICNYSKYQQVGQSEGHTQGQGRGTAGAQQGHKQEEISNTDQDKKEGSPLDNEKAAFEAFNAVAEKVGLPVAQRLSPTRRAQLRQRLTECGGLIGWTDAMDKLENSDFCCGRNANGWKADLDFVLQASSFTKLMEGSYDNRAPPVNASKKPDYFDGLKNAAQAAARNTMGLG